MNTGLQAAIRRFPDFSTEIEELIRRDEDFGSLCSDLSAAEAALESVDQLAPALRAERRAECQGWIEALTAEIREVLASANVVSISRRPKR